MDHDRRTFLKTTSRSQRNLTDSDLIGRDVAHRAGAQKQKWSDEQYRHATDAQTASADALEKLRVDAEAWCCRIHGQNLPRTRLEDTARSAEELLKRLPFATMRATSGAWCSSNRGDTSLRHPTAGAGPFAAEIIEPEWILVPILPYRRLIARFPPVVFEKGLVGRCQEFLVTLP